MCVGITAYSDFKQGLSRLPEVELSAYLCFLLSLLCFAKQLDCVIIIFFKGLCHDCQVHFVNRKLKQRGF